PGRQGQDCALAGAQEPDQRHDAVRVRPVSPSPRKLPLRLWGRERGRLQQMIFDELETREEYPMHMRHPSLRSLLLAGGISFAALGGACAADVTYERLANPDKEPQNWLMVHRSYDAQRFSPLDQINKQNVKNLKLLFAVAIGGTSGNESLE